MTKAALALIFSVWAFPIWALIEKYLFCDWEFLTFLIILMTVDTFTGLYKCYKQKSISHKGWGKVLDKLLSYGAILVVMHVLVNFTVDDHKLNLFQWIETFAYISLIVKEGISIIENIGAINPNMVPSRLLSKLKSFDKSGKFIDDEK